MRPSLALSLRASPLAQASGLVMLLARPARERSIRRVSTLARLEGGDCRCPGHALALSFSVAAGPMRASARLRAGVNPNEGMPHGFHALRSDPAVERWAWMRENVYTTFKFTPRITLQLFGYLVVLPYVVYQAIETSHLKNSKAPAQGGSPAFRSRPPGSYKKSEPAAAPADDE